MKTRQLFVLLLGIALFAMSVRETLDPDLWWHLRTGEAIWLQGALPDTDIFSYTVPDHEWIVQQWLTDTLMWLAYRYLGLTGLSILFALIVAATFMLVFHRCAGRPYLAAFVTLLAFMTSALPIGVRPQMFNMLFLALFVWIIEGVRDGALHRRYLLLTPILTVLWANMHSGYLSGVALLIAYTAGQGVQIGLARSDSRTLNGSGLRLLVLGTIAALFAALLNPRGYKLWLFPVLTLGSQAIQANIAEWHSPDFHFVYYWFFGLMMALGVVSWVFSQERPGWTDLLLFGGTAAAGLLSARHIPLFAVVSAPIVSRHLLSSFASTSIYPLLSGQRPELSARGALSVLNWAVLFAAVLTVMAWTLARLENNELALTRHFPVAAVDFIETSGLSDGRVYNTYEWGGYLIWRRIPVFIDGRTELYGDEFFLYYLQAVQLRDNWREPLVDFEVDYVLLRREASLTTLLAASGEWREAYADELAVVMVPDISNGATR